MKILFPFKKSGHIDSNLVWILRLWDYIKTKNELVEEDKEGNADMVLICIWTDFLKGYGCLKIGFTN